MGRPCEPWVCDMYRCDDLFHGMSNGTQICTRYLNGTVYTNWFRRFCAHDRGNCRSGHLFVATFSSSVFISQHNAATAGSYGIILSIGVSALLGWFLLLGLLFSIQDSDRVLGAETGQPVAQIFIDAVGNNGAIALMVIIVVAMYFCGWVSLKFLGGVLMVIAQNLLSYK